MWHILKYLKKIKPRFFLKENILIQDIESNVDDEQYERLQAFVYHELDLIKPDPALIRQIARYEGSPIPRHPHPFTSEDE